MPTAAPSVTKMPQHRTEQHPAARGQDRARDEQRAEDGRRHDVRQRRRGPVAENRAAHRLEVDDPRDGHQIEHRDEKPGEHGEAHDVVVAGMSDAGDRRC